MTAEKTLAIIKPDAVRNGHAQEIKRMIEAKGFLIVCKEKVQLSREAAARFYQEHEGKEFFEGLLNFMTSGPVWTLVLQKTNAIGGWREMMGPTNTLKAKEEAPDSLRAMFGTDGTQNATHGSDSQASAEREIRFFFPGLLASCGPTGLPTIEWTLAMIKPDAVKKGKAEEIKQLIQLNGFTIVAQQKIQLTRPRAEEFYAEHHGKSFFPTLIDFMTSGPIWALVLSKCNAITGWRQMMGPTNTLKAKAEAPRSLRALYGTDGTMNATHGSDSKDSAMREIKFHFPQLVMEPLCESDAAKEYIKNQLEPALCKALTALAREKPSAERFEAITYLADYLLNNNPNKPRIIMPDEWDPSMEEEDEEEEFQNARLAGAMTEAPIVSASVARSAPLVSAADVDGAESADAASKPPAAPTSRQVSSSGMPPVPPSGSRPTSARPGSRGSAAGGESREDAAATTIQAAYRGHEERMAMDEQAPEEAAAPAEAEPVPAPVAEGEAIPDEGEAAPAAERAASPPAEGDAAPAEGDAAAERAATPPAEEEAAPPAEEEAAPADGEAAPAEGEAAPAEDAPAESEAEPAEEAADPAEGEAATAEGDAAPVAEEAAAPAEDEAAPAESEAAPAAEGQAGPAEEAAVPAEGEAASGEEAAAPAAEATETAPAEGDAPAHAEGEPEAAPAEEGEAAPAEASEEARPASAAAEEAAAPAAEEEAAPDAEASEAAPDAEASEAAPDAEASEAAPDAEASEAAPAAEASEPAPAAEASSADPPGAEAAEEEEAPEEAE